MNTGLETPWGGGPENPSIDEMRAALAELSTPDAEHPDAWLEDEEGWCLVVFQTGRVLLLGPGAKEVCRRERVSMDEALELWMLLQQGRRDEIKQRLAA